jgi:hypothetical protein
MTFIVVQLANIHPRDDRVPKGVFTGDGVLTAITCDGFYSNAEAAHEVASYLAKKHPKLKTVISEVVVMNDPADPFLWGPYPDLPRHENEAPPAFQQKVEERAKMTSQLRYQIIKRDGYRCRACGYAVQDGARLHVDHITAVANGGRTVPENLQTLCAACNIGKGAS